MACAHKKTSPGLDPASDDDDDAASAKSDPADTPTGTPSTSDSLKRKHHRRARRSGKRRRSSLNLSKDATSPTQATSPTPQTERTKELGSDAEGKSPPCSHKEASPEAGSGAGPSPGNRHRPHRHHRGKRQHVYLRPTNGPLLRAPSNSTQFIIDDHENSHLFLSFDQQASHPSSAASTNGASGYNATPPSHARERSLGPPSGSASADDDTLWAEYSERDFQSVYETAHHEEVSTWDRKKLCEEISVLERKQKELANALARLDPDVYLQQLQGQLLALQETNRALREQASRQAEAEAVAPDSSTGTEEAAEGASGSVEEQPEPVQDAASQH